jgi:hypothetical protein
MRDGQQYPRDETRPNCVRHSVRELRPNTRPVPAYETTAPNQLLQKGLPVTLLSYRFPVGRSEIWARCLAFSIPPTALVCNSCRVSQTTATSSSARATEVTQEKLRFPICPACGRDDVRRSRSKGLFDSLARTLGFRPYRCRACRTRYLSSE